MKGVYKHYSHQGFQKGRIRTGGVKKGYKYDSPRALEFVKKCVEARKGYKHSKETKEKIGIANKKSHPYFIELLEKNV